MTYAADLVGSLEERLSLRFGLPEFHPWQKDAIEALLTHRKRVLVVAPTGGGKSLCYQFPATELEGTCLVISPLIALMEDQVRSLQQRGIAATWLSSTLSPEEVRRRERALLEGAYELAYLAPERLNHPHTLAQLRRLQLSMVAIDEAHCISQWGHDFRPDYLRMTEALDALQAPRMLACTATATPQVRQEIQERLGMAGAGGTVVLRGFARPNLHLAARFEDSSKQRKAAALEALDTQLGQPSAPRGGAILYAQTRRTAQQWGDELARSGWRAGVYHGGLAPEERTRVADAFAAGFLDVVVATNAFGMGIDRSDIRLVVHVQAPGSIEAYYQEVGRAGRDGQPAHGLLLTSMSDFPLRKLLLSGGDEEASESANQHKWQLFLDLIRYVEAGSCRHDFILRYFEDEQELLGGCGHCDVCENFDARSAEAEQASEEEMLVVRQALAGVARCKGRVGLRAIADMLRGAEDKRMTRLSLDRLSTHGLLKSHAKTWIMALLRRLVTADLVTLSDPTYPVAKLTKKGWDVMQGKAPVRVLLPVHTPTRPERHAAPQEAALDYDHVLYDALRQARLDLARKAGVPAYVICHDRTLKEIAAAKPASPEALAHVHGMGPARLNSYGSCFLEVVRQAPEQRT